MTIPPSRFTELRMLPLSLRLGGFDTHMLGWGFFEPRWWRNYLHEHSYFEICYAFAGCGTFTINGVSLRVGAGDVFVARPGEPHEIISDEADPLGIYFWSYTLIPPPTRSAEPVDHLLHAFLTAPRWVNRRPSMQITLDLLTEEIALRQPGYAENAAALVGKLLIDTARAVTDLAPVERDDRPVHDAAGALVADMVHYLRDNYSRPVRVRDVAAQVHLSERHTNRLFHAVMGVSIKDYLTDFRLGVAKQLLLNPQLSIGAVAYASGYPDVRHFATVFRQRTGLTPGRYRQRGGTVFLNPAS